MKEAEEEAICPTAGLTHIYLHLERIQSEQSLYQVRISMERRVSPPRQELAIYERPSRATYGRQVSSEPYLEPYYPSQTTPYNDSYRLQSALYRRMNRSPPTRQNNIYGDRRSAQLSNPPYKSMSRSPPANNTLSLYQPYSSYRRPAAQTNAMSLYQTRRAYAEQYPYQQYQRDYYRQYPQYPQQYSPYRQYPQNPPYNNYQTRQYEERRIAPIVYAQPPEMAARSYMYGATQNVPKSAGYISGSKSPKRRKYNESRVSNRSMTSQGSYNSYNSDLNNTRRRIEYREGYKKKEKTSICTPCCLGVLGMLLLLALLTGLFFLIRGVSNDSSSGSASNLQANRQDSNKIDTRSTLDLQTGVQGDELTTSTGSKPTNSRNRPQQQDVSPIIIADYNTYPAVSNSQTDPRLTAETANNNALATDTNINNQEYTQSNISGQTIFRGSTSTTLPNLVQPLDSKATIEQSFPVTHPEPVTEYRFKPQTESSQSQTQSVAPILVNPEPAHSGP